MSDNLFVINDKRVKRFIEDLKRSKTDYEEELAKFTEQASTNFKYAIEWQAKHVLRAQARYEIAAGLLGVDLDEEAGVADVASWLATELNRLQHVRDGESGSTSAFDNTSRDITQAVTARYIGMLLG